MTLAFIYKYKVISINNIIKSKDLNLSIVSHFSPHVFIVYALILSLIIPVMHLSRAINFIIQD